MKALLVLLFAVSAWAQSGKVTEYSIESKLYGRSRRVWMYTPAGYDSHSTYALLVCFDGADYLKEIALPETLDRLIVSKAMPPTVALMVDTSVNRLDDLANHQKFVEFLSNELLPWARKAVQISDDPSRISLAGYSAGGSAAGYAAFKRPDLFGNVLAQSGAFWRGDEGTSSEFEWLTQQISGGSKRNIRFYLEVGENETSRVLGSGPVFIEANRRLRDALK